MNRISAVLITYNEEEKVERALKSLKGVADEIVVVDSHSTDATADICRRYADRFSQRAWQGFRAQKQFATDEATHPWVLSLDADELLSPRARQEILAWKKERPGHHGYLFPRKTFFMGRWITHTTWYPDWQLRLFLRSKGRWTGGRLHESFHTEGSTGHFGGPIYHHTYASFSEYLQQLDRFSTLAAQDCLEGGRRARWIHFCVYPPAAFLKNYLWCRGFLDGVPGLLVSLLAATSSLFKYLKLWQIQSGDAGRLPPRLLHE